MNCANIIIVGKTGAGKSTLVNAIVGQKVAPTGQGGAVTKENKIYTCEKNIDTFFSTKKEWKINVYDTVGLELNQKITEKTLKDVEYFLTNAQRKADDKDITIVWLCINHRSHRFEKYELAVVNKMSIKHEIPFSILLTKCVSNDESIIEEQLRTEYPQIDVKRILAEDYCTRVGKFAAYGVEEALDSAIRNYNSSKVEVLELKLEYLRTEREKKIENIKEKGRNCIEKYEKKAGKIGVLLGGCIPFVHGICISMMMELGKIVGINASKDFASDIFANAIVGIILTPLMVVPGLSTIMAEAYVETVGEDYFDVLLAVIERSTDEELKDNDIVSKRIKNELKKRKK